ncbi:MAG TPA: NAD-glutamate dehydrogenase, partial [Mycobacteriales bacterium]|nr:NAD-glutamate dehydrogenase [Mycobacteriales bacterium]
LEDVRAAVEDWPDMREAVRSVAASVVEDSPADLADQAAEARRLLEWLADGNFTFLGYREYDLSGEPGSEELQSRAGTGRGILRDDPADPTEASESFGRLPSHAREKSRERRILVLTKANSRATVHRRAYLDYIGVKAFGARGEVVGERRLLGLFTSAAYTESVRRVPVVDRKVDQLLQRAALAPDSHSGKDLLTICETYPRDELFQTDVDVLYETVMAVLHLQERRRTKLFLRADDYGRFVSALVFLPRDRYTTAVRLRMQEILADAYGAEQVDFTTRVSESVLARLHFVVRTGQGQRIPEVDPGLIEARLVEATRSWEEDLADALAREVGESEATRLVRRWGGGFPEAYKEDFAARSAVADLQRIERVTATAPDAGEPMVLNLYEPVGAAPDLRRVKLFRRSALSLTSVLPYFRNLGLEVVDERPYELETSAGERAWIYDFGLRLPGRSASWATRSMVTDAFVAGWSGAAESDGLDQLVLGAGLTWRQVVVLRAYARYLRQAGSTFSQQYVEGVLL